MIKSLTNIDSIQTKEDLAEYILSLKQDFLTNRGQWENTDIPTYLDAMAAWLGDCRDPAMESPTALQNTARILYVGKLYE